MNILVVGNGFDLAHDLPTRYSDFLDFMTLYITKNYPGWQKLGTDPFHDGNNYFQCYNSIIADALRKISKNSKVRILFNNYEEIFKELMLKEKSLEKFYLNSFFRYCLGVYSYKKNFDSEFNWVDIEEEISHFLISFQSKSFTKASLKSTSIQLPFIYGDSYTIIPFFIPTVYQALKSKNIPMELLRKEIFTCLFEELEAFSLILKIYLKVVSEYSKEHLEKKFQINAENAFEATEGICINRIVSFNYTDTVKIYTPNAPVHFVNGNLNNSKIILGIENPVPEPEKNNSNVDDIAFFFKNVQRVLYNMFYDYRNWIPYTNPFVVENEDKSKSNVYTGTNIYIIGHSLAVSDKYILTDLMTDVNTVTIYYHDKKDMEDKIRNLYKILGDLKFSQHVNNNTARPFIKLVNQSEITIEKAKT